MYSKIGETKSTYLPEALQMLRKAQGTCFGANGHCVL